MSAAWFYFGVGFWTVIGVVAGLLFVFFSGMLLYWGSAVLAGVLTAMFGRSK